MFNLRMSGAEFRALRQALGLSQSFMAARILNKDGVSLQLRTLSHWEQSRTIMPPDAVALLLRYKHELDDLTGWMVEEAENIWDETGTLAFLTAYRDDEDLAEYGPDLGMMQGMGVDAYNICLANAVDDLASPDLNEVENFEQALEDLDPDQDPVEQTPRVPAWVTMFNKNSYLPFLEQREMEHSHRAMALWGAETTLAAFDREIGDHKDQPLS